MIYPLGESGFSLGTSPTIADRYVNPFYQNRIVAAEALIREGKIKYLIISGDNGKTEYTNRNHAFRFDQIRGGLQSALSGLCWFPAHSIHEKLKEIFGQDSVTVISQKFHNERAIYIAEHEGIDAIGFNARDISTRDGLRTELRENSPG